MDDLSGQDIRGYKLIERIGEGGFGVVYRAEQPAVDREVSIKVILPEYAKHPEFVRRFEAEARMVAKLEHPHIVPLYDYWRDEEGAFLVMRWLRGGSLRDALESGPWEVEALGQLLEQIADALRLAHEQGVIHRDLKPENILLDEDGHAYLTDFGIAKDIAGEGLTQTGKIVGSVDYLAPEQAKGEEVTPRTDIYGLGVVLYEMLTGEHPFPGMTTVQMIQKHLNQPLPSIREIQLELPEAVDHVIQRATAKNPEERYSDALEVVEAYKRALTIEGMPIYEPQLPVILEEVDEEIEVQRPVFVGRERELSQLDGFLEKTLTGQGQVVFVTGGAGRGKTALVNEFCRRTLEGHAKLIITTGNCNAQTGLGDPYLPFRDVFSMLTGDVEKKFTVGSITREHAQRLWKILPQTIDALLDFGTSSLDVLVFGETLLERTRVALPRGDERLRRLAKLVERRKSRVDDIEQSHLFEQCTNVLCDVSTHHPLLLFVDDLQWADNASISLLFHLGRRIAGDRILIIGAYRPDEVALGREGDRHPLEGIVNELKREYGDVILDLSLEEEAEGKGFVEDFLDTEPNHLSSSFRQALYEHTGGHPLFTIELLRAMQDRGDIIKDEDGNWLEGPSLVWDTLPARIEAVIEERIGRLEEDLREALSVASVEGEDFTVQVLARVQDIKERQLLRELSQEMEKRHRLVREQEELRVNGLLLSRYSFAHQLIQRYLYNDLSAGERRLLHGEVASVLEELFEDRSDQIAVQLAFHYHQAENSEKELIYLIQAGYQALDLYANQEAEKYYSRALKLAESETERAELHSGLGEAMFGQSRFTEAIQTWREGIDLYHSLGAEGFNGMARLYARSARACSEAGDWPEGLKLCQEGLDAIEYASESYEIALLVHEAARAYYFNGLPEEAEALCRKALQMAESMGSLEVQADTLATYGVLPNLTPAQALDALTKAVEIAETAGLLHIAIRAHNNLSIIKSYLLSDLRGERNHYLRAFEISRKVGSYDIICITNAFDVSLRLGDYALVAETLPEVTNVVSRLPDPSFAEGIINKVSLDMMIHQGQWMDTLEPLRNSLREAQQQSHLQRISIYSTMIAFVLLEQIRLGELNNISDIEAELVSAIEICDRGLGGRVWPRCLLIMTYAHLRRFKDAHILLAETQDIAGPEPSIVDEANINRAAAELAFIEMRWSDALTAYEVAAKLYAQMEMRPWWARALMLWADVHVARGELGDLERAEALLQDAKSAYEDMGVPYFVGIVEEKLEGLQVEAEG
jgi:tetratricopeptide (TPR) repeat protein/predicted Ser/Thr protein kinase